MQTYTSLRLPGSPDGNAPSHGHVAPVCSILDTLMELAIIAGLTALSLAAAQWIDTLSLGVFS